MGKRPTRIVCIGGGTGLSTLLRGLKRDFSPTAIVTMADSGGHSGLLRDDLGMLPPGDVRACLVALVDDDKETVMRDLFNYRFTNGSHNGTSVGNLLLAALSDLRGGFGPAVEIAHEILRVNGRVIPVTLDPVDLLAELEDGTILFGEKTIDLPRAHHYQKIKRVWLQPKVRANLAAIEAIGLADVIIFGPGDLYTSILPNLFVSGINAAVKDTKAKLVYISNIMTKYTETHGFEVADFVDVLQTAINRPLDGVIYNSTPLPKHLVAMYAKDRAYQVITTKPQPDWIGADVLLTAKKLARHDSRKLADVINRLVCDEWNYPIGVRNA